jgi:hypothetical protein
MALLDAGIDITVIALWLGHEFPATTRVYLHDMKLKEHALSRLAPGSIRKDDTRRPTVSWLSSTRCDPGSRHRERYAAPDTRR